MDFERKSKPSSTKENPPLPESSFKKSIEMLHWEEALRNELVNTKIDIAEKDLKISIRKKSGTRL